MALRLNPFTGQLDICGDSGTKWVFNPFLGQLDRDANTGGWVFNPFTGMVDAIAVAPTSPDTLMIWGANNAIEWEATNSLRWGN